MDELCPLHVAVRDSDLEKIKALLNDNPALAPDQSQILRGGEENGRRFAEG